MNQSICSNKFCKQIINKNKYKIKTLRNYDIYNIFFEDFQFCCNECIVKFVDNYSDNFNKIIDELDKIKIENEILNNKIKDPYDKKTFSNEYYKNLDNDINISDLRAK